MKLLLVPSLLAATSAFLCAQSFTDNLVVGTSQAAADAGIEIGKARTADGASFVNFTAESASAWTYALRIGRTAGANGIATFMSHGTGAVQVGTFEAGSVALMTNGVSRFSIASAGDATLSQTDDTARFNLRNAGSATSTTSRTPGLVISNFSGATTAGYPVIYFQSSQGTYATPTGAATGQYLGSINFNGYTPTNNVQVGARIRAFAESAFSDTSSATSLAMLTASSSGGEAEHLRITSTGFVGINTATPTTSLEVNGEAKATTLTSTQVSCSTAAGSDRGTILKTGTVNRWYVGADNSAETGTANAGSDFFVRRYGDTGTLLDAPLSIKRTSGVVDVGAAAAGHLRVLASGQVVIGGASAFQVYTGAVLSVNGTAAAKEVIVSPTGWSDYVFDQGYQLMPLSEVEKRVVDEHHLPGVPSAAEVARDGVAVGDMQSLHLKKIEELTLYAIAADKRVAKAEAQVALATAAITETTAKLNEQQRQIDDLKRLVAALAGAQQAAQPHGE